MMIDAADPEFPTQIRSLPILILYLLIAFALAARICHSLSQYAALALPSRSPATAEALAKPRVQLHKVFLFSLLAVLSLATTWYHMLRFFQLSYHAWTCKRTVAETQLDVYKLELWLRDTKLFKEAWETVIETAPRFWWSQQIFLWTTGWSLFLGYMGRRYGIRNAWMYMLLGQIVAVSFAQNLFYLAIILSSARQGRPGSMAWGPDAVFDVMPVLLSLFGTFVIPYTAHTALFYPVLLVPHLLLFLPTLWMLRTPSFLTSRSRHGPTALKMGIQGYILLFKSVAFLSLLLNAKAILFALLEDTPAPARYSFTECGMVVRGEQQSALFRLLGTIFDHPAVSSVSWDVIFCTVGFVAWMATNGLSASQMLGEVGLRQEEEAESAEKWESAGKHIDLRTTGSGFSFVRDEITTSNRLPGEVRTRRGD